MPSIAHIPFANLLRQHRLAAGLTQEGLADRAGLSVHGIQKLERGGSHPHRETLRRLVVALRLAADDEVVFRSSAQPIPRGDGDSGAGASLAPGRLWPDLPTSLTSCIGREQEIAEVTDLLGSVRLLTLTGVGGCGKTRLALEIARLATNRYADGIWLVELASITDALLVPQAVASVLGVRESSTQSLLTTLTASLRQSRLLLVLDNCEHLIEACAQLANTLLRSCPSVQILATSREALSIPGEVSRRVPSLPVPALDPLPAAEELRAYAAVQLFVERARAVHPKFDVTARNATAIAQVCRRLDGMPLALELAAARVGGLSVEQLAARLDQRFRLLTGGSRAALARQQTLRATIDWSYDLLSSQERALFTCLSVFAGDWTVEASQAVCADGEIGSEQVIELLMRLVDKSLVVAEEDAEGTQRYRLLDTLRQYAREQLLVSGDAETVHGRHAAYYLRLAQRIELELAEPRYPAAWLARLAMDDSNMRAALEWFYGRGDAENALHMAAVLWRFWEVRGYLREGRSRLAELLALPGASAPTLARARVLDGAGVLALYQYDLGAARAFFKDSLALYRRHGEARGTAWVLIHLGWLCHDAGRYKAARRFLVQGLAMARETCDEAAVARCLSLLGMLAYGELDFATARSLHEQSLALNWEAENRWGSAWALHLLGRDLLEQVETGEADVHMVRTVLEQSVAAWRELDERRHQAFANVDLGLLAIRQGDFDLGRRRLDESLATFVELDDRGDTVFILCGYADLFGAQGQLDLAVRVLGAVSGLMPTMGMVSSPLKSQQTEHHLARARATLPPDVLAAAWTAGSAMSLSQAVAFVREHNPDCVLVGVGQTARRAPELHALDIR